MPRSLGYIDAGDRVKIKNVQAFGERGVVLSNNGWGTCRVRTDSGQTFVLMNGRDLIYEDEELPAEPVTDTDIVP